MRPASARISLIALLALHGLAAISPLLALIDEGLAPLILLACFLLLTQPILLALWAGLAVAPLRRRLPTALGLLLVAHFLLAFSLRAAEPRNDSTFTVAVWLFTVALAVFLLLYLLLGVFRRRRRLRLLAPSQSPYQVSESYDDRQFRLRDLLLWTTGIAVILAAGRLLAADSERLPADLAGYGLIAWAFVIPSATVLAVAPLAFCGALLAGDGRWVGIAMLVALAASLTVGLLPIGIHLFTGDISDWGEAFLGMALFAGAFQFFMMPAMLVSLLWLRLAGWRVVRLPLPGEPPPTDWKAPPIPPHVYLQQLAQADAIPLPPAPPGDTAEDMPDDNSDDNETTPAATAPPPAHPHHARADRSSHD